MHSVVVELHCVPARWKVLGTSKGALCTSRAALCTSKDALCTGRAVLYILGGMQGTSQGTSCKNPVLEFLK